MAGSQEGGSGVRDGGTGLLRTAGECLESLTGCVLESVARAGSAAAIDPRALLFLLHRHAATDREDLRDVLGAALALALDGFPAQESGAGNVAVPVRDRPAGIPGLDGEDWARWLTVFTEASLISEDPRLFTAASDLDRRLRARWPAAGRIAGAAEAVEACLVSASAASSRDLLQSAVDELERLVGGSYRPGSGVGDGRLGDQTAAASALLTAFALTGRLPYSMLAEELMQFARRTLWDPRDGGFFDGGGIKPFAANCEAARVCCRLESLHRDEEYRRAAVLAGATTYVDDAELALASQTPDPGQRGLEVAVYGIALIDWLHLKGDLK